MGTLRLLAIGIDEVRDVSSGSDAVITRLRTLALAAWPPPPPPHRRNLLSKLGPLTKVGIGAPVIRPGVPTGRDLDDLTHGHDVPADRLDAVWSLLRLYLDDTAFSHLELELTERELDDLDFEASIAGLDPRLGLRRVLNDDVGLALKSLPGQVTGYVRGTHAEAMAHGWQNAAASLPAPQAALAGQVADWLAGFPLWRAEALAHGREHPDLVASFRFAEPTQAMS